MTSSTLPRFVMCACWAAAAGLGFVGACNITVNQRGSGGSGGGTGVSGVALELAEAGVFQLLPGITETNLRAIVIFDELPADPPTSATLTLRAEDVFVRESSPGSGPIDGPAQVTLHLAPAQPDDPCASAIAVGPFELEVDDGQVAIAEETLDLTVSGVELAYTGRFFICIEAQADFVGILEIVRVSIDFGDGVAPADPPQEPANENEQEEPPANQPPAADIQPDLTEGVAPLAVSFDGSGSSDSDGHVIDYAWDFDDGQIGAGQAADHVFEEPGTYEVTLTVTDDDGATDQASVTVTATTVPVSTIIHRGTANQPFYPVSLPADADREIIGAGVSGDGEVIYFATPSGGQTDHPSLWRSNRDGDTVAAIDVSEVVFVGEEQIDWAVNADGLRAFFVAGTEGAIYRVENNVASLIFDPAIHTDEPIEGARRLLAGADGSSLTFQDTVQPWEIYRLDGDGWTPTLVLDPEDLPDQSTAQGNYRGLMIKGYDAADDGTVVATVLRRRDDDNANADFVDLYRVSGGLPAAVTTTHDVVSDGQPSIADDGTLVYLRDLEGDGSTIHRTGFILGADQNETAAQEVSDAPMYLVRIAADGSRLVAGFESADGRRRSTVVAGDLASSLTLPIELSADGTAVSDSLETILDLSATAGGTSDGPATLQAVSPGRLAPADYPQVTAVTVWVNTAGESFTVSATVTDADGSADISEVTAWILGPGDRYVDSLDPALNPFLRDDGVEVVGRSNDLTADPAEAGLYTLTAGIPHPERLTDQFRLRLVAADQAGRTTYTDTRFIPLEDETVDTDGDGVGD